MRTILALGVAVLALTLAGCPNYGTVEWINPTPPTPTAPGPDMTGPTAPGPDMADASQPPDMSQPPACVPACEGKVCGSDDGCQSTCQEGSGCTAPDMAQAPPDMGSPPDLSPPPDAGCVPAPVVDCPYGDQSEPNGKVTLCHIPPGNPANRHTITVGDPAAAAHLAHGDYLGPCKAVCQ